MWVIIMKKTEYISFRTSADVKEVLMREAEEKKWSISQLVEQIVHQWVDSKENQDASPKH